MIKSARIFPEREDPLQSATWRSVWPSCRTEPNYTATDPQEHRHQMMHLQSPLPDFGRQRAPRPGNARACHAAGSQRRQVEALLSANERQQLRTQPSWSRFVSLSRPHLLHIQHRSTPSWFYPFNGSVFFQSVTRRSVWPFCQQSARSIAGVLKRCVSNVPRATRFVIAFVFLFRLHRCCCRPPLLPCCLPQRRRGLVAICFRFF